MSENDAKGITWDLSDLYPSIQSGKISEDLKEAQKKAGQFQKQYKPLLEDLLGTEASKQSKKAQGFPLSKLLKDYKEIAVLTTQLNVFAFLSFAEKSNDSAIGAFLQKIQTDMTEIQNHLVFFEVSWNKLPQAAIAIMLNKPDVQADRHFLEKIRIFAPYTLTEGEESIMGLKANTGARAFTRLFDEVSNNITFTIELDGKKQNKNKSEILALLHSHHREERKKSGESLAQGLETHSHILTYIYNMILADHRTNLKIRKHQHPIEPMNLMNEIDLASVMHLMESVKKAYTLGPRFYTLKKRLLGIEKLYDYDRYAPFQLQETKISFKACREIVLSSYYHFSEDVGKIVEQFFTKRWIDAEVREGKSGGGFCAQTTPDLHPYILVNYTGSLRDVMTVAHELGHGLHQYLAAKRVGVLESDAPLTLAETASVFGEMIIFENLLEKETDTQKRLALISGKIDDQFATVFRQIILTDFELMAHTEGIEKGELSSERLSDLWMKANQDFYGESVELTPSYRQGWKYIQHFIHSPFYCYAYSFAQLFVLSLFQKYKENKKSFVPKYLEMLSLGGSRKPEELAQIMGLDFRAPNFWKSGIEILTGLIQQAEELSLQSVPNPLSI